MNGTTKDTLLSFPCDFTIKVFGKEENTFEETVLGIIKQQVEHLADDAVQSRLSENGNYKALSITVHVTSKDQLDNIYRALSKAPQVLMVL